MSLRDVNDNQGRPVTPPATLRLNVDADALAHNWRALDRLSGTASAAAAVKADAYGLGVAQVAPVLRAAGARQFYVAHWAEVPALMDHVPPAEISVLHGPVTAADARYAVATGVRPVINSLHQAALWIDACGHGRSLPCDLMVDTGMNRLGVELADIGNEVLMRLQVDTVHSHLASADEDVAQNGMQLERFGQVASAVPARRRALANSAGIALGADYAFDMTRPGIALYGGVPRGELAGVVRQVAFPQAAVIQLRTARAGERIGYNGTHVAQHDMRLATLSLGYADGYLRCWSGQGMVTFDGAVLPVVGRVSMDLVIVDCAAANTLREGDFVDVAYDLPWAAAASGLSQYELLTGLAGRFTRSG